MRANCSLVKVVISRSLAVEAYTTDEEQLEALKNWWKENGKSIIIGVVLAVGAVFGWRAWQSYQHTMLEQASDLYEELVDATQISNISNDEVKFATVTHLSGRLKNEFDSSTYASYAALLLAKTLVEKNELDGAVGELQWVLDRSNPEENVYQIARVRLAKVLLALGGDDNANKALALFGSNMSSVYKASIEEIRGDLYFSLKQFDKAREAYSIALIEAKRIGSNNPILQIKLNDLAKDEA